MKEYNKNKLGLERKTMIEAEEKMQCIICGDSFMERWIQCLMGS
jgi:hypothetical protein